MDWSVLLSVVNTTDTVWGLFLVFWFLYWRRRNGK